MITIQIMDASSFETTTLSKDLLKALKRTPGLVFGDWIKMNTNIRFQSMNPALQKFNIVLKNLVRQKTDKLFISLES